MGPFTFNDGQLAATDDELATELYNCRHHVLAVSVEHGLIMDGFLNNYIGLHNIPPIERITLAQSPFVQGHVKKTFNALSEQIGQSSLS